MTKTKITSNILGNITNRLNGQGFSEGKGKALVVLNGTTMDYNRTYGFIHDLKNKYEISLGFSFMAERLLDTNKIINEIRPAQIYREEDMLRLNAISKEYAALYGPNISINTLSKVSTGMIDSFISNLIWTFLYFGKDVYLDFNSVREYMGVKPGNKEMEKIIENYISTVIKMGAIEISTGEIQKSKVHLFGNMENISNTEKKSNKASEQKNLIVEKDIRRLSKNQVLVIDKDTLITPLARDKARELGIKIEKK